MQQYTITYRNENGDKIDSVFEREDLFYSALRSLTTRYGNDAILETKNVNDLNEGMVQTLCE